MLSAVLCTGTAAAQSKWVDRDGRVTYGDAPPAGVNAAPMRRAPAALSRVEDAPADKDSKDDAKDAKKPLTPAEQDAAFRKRQQEAEKDREKHAKAERDLADKRDNCTRAREYTRTLDAGRVVRTDAKGESYYLDDGQIAQERKRA
ncbi:MAG: DUF4124 domain-containing protein, partial [Xanthobacteraceae bacterium]